MPDYELITDAGRCKLCRAGLHLTAEEHNKDVQERILPAIRALVATYPPGELPISLAAQLGGLMGIGGRRRRKPV